MIEGVIFDLDGVLVDTEGFQWQGWVEVLKPHGINLSKEEYTEKYAGQVGTNIEMELIQCHKLNIDKGALLELKEKVMLDLVQKEEIRLMYYAKEAVDYFIAKELPVALVSGGPRKEVDLKLKRTNLMNKFAATISRNDVERGKPHPDSYLLGARRLGVAPEHCIAFEDTMFGVQSAKAAGLVCLAIPNEFSKKQDFSKADGVFSNLKEAIDWVSKRHCC